MNLISKLIFLITAFLSLAAGRPSGKTISPDTGLKVIFLGDQIIPGKLTKFGCITKSSDSLPEINASYFLGYNSDYLYIYIEADGDSIVTRDRGYQNGDGFHLTIGKANNDGSETDDFFVLGFSAKEGWCRKMSWYYNSDLKMGSLGEDVKFKSFRREGKICFETLIPWEIIKPYHPWIGGKIGFNLCFVKAMNDHDKLYSFIVKDDKMQSEQSKRKYINLCFEAPDQVGKSYSIPQRNNYRRGDEMKIEIAGYAGKARKTPFTIRIEDKGEKVVATKHFSLKVKSGQYNTLLSFGKIELNPGSYYVKIYESKKEIGEHIITIIEEFNFNYLRKDISMTGSRVSKGTFATILFKIDETEREFEKLKSYESCEKINNSILEIKQNISLLQSGIDPFSKKTGSYRRAYISKKNSTTMPYYIYVPLDYDKNRSYPLLVYLHGSGQDDHALERADFIKDGYIVVAPNGRGVSNCFYTKESQEDISDAIDDVEREFNIDKKRVVLSGFSMGGYGVFRTFIENPDRYSAIAIISGHPDLARKMVDKNGINFLDEKYKQLFNNISVFIYHSKDDINCPYILMRQFAENIKTSNPNVRFVEDENMGHGKMSVEAKKEYFNWLKK